MAAALRFMATASWLPASIWLAAALVLLAAAHQIPAPEATPAAPCSERDAARMLRRMGQKSRIAAEVTDGRATLLEAAGLFRALDRQPPALTGEMLRTSHQCRSDEEAHCREVIRWVAEQTDADPCATRAACTSLERELVGRLERGPLRLPDAISPPLEE